MVRFEVADNGVGITPDQMDRLFRAFEQGDPSIARKYGGTGLGLAITRRIGQLMGGKVGADSTPGKGSTFWSVSYTHLDVYKRQAQWPGLLPDAVRRG